MLEKYENASDFYNSITYTESVMLYILCLCRVFKDKLISIEKVKEDYSMRYRLTFETKAGRTFQSCVFVKDSPPGIPGRGWCGGMAGRCTHTIHRTDSPNFTGGIKWLGDCQTQRYLTL